MKKCKIDYKKYIESMGWKNYAIIDPPWNLGDKPPKAVSQLKYDLWKNNVKDLLWIFDNIKCDIIFLWVIQSIDMEIWEAYFQTMVHWNHKTNIDWVKLTKNRKIHYGIGHWFRNSTEAVKLFVKPTIKPFHLSMRNIITARKKDRTWKPKKWEHKLVSELYNLNYKKGCYLFSGSDVDCFENYDVDCVDICL